MYMSKLPYLLAVVPIAALLTASFFVLFTIRKIEEKGLKAFGYVVAGFLWLAALMVFSAAVYKLGQGPERMKDMMHPKMKMDHLSEMMPKYNAPAMVMPQRVPLAKGDKFPGCSKCQRNKGVVFKNK